MAGSKGAAAVCAVLSTDHFAVQCKHTQLEGV